MPSKNQPQPGDILVVFDAFHDELEKISAKLPRWWMSAMEEALGVDRNTRLGRDLIRRMEEAAEKQGIRETVIPGRPARTVVKEGVTWREGARPELRYRTLSIVDPETLITRNPVTGDIVGRQVGPPSALTGRPDPRPEPMKPIHVRMEEAKQNLRAKVEAASEEARKNLYAAGKVFRRKKPLGG